MSAAPTPPPSVRGGPRSPFARAGSVARWSARILGVLLAILFLIFALGGGERGGRGPDVGEWAMMTALLVAFAGFAIGWRSDALGGTAILAGFVIFEAINLSRAGQFALGPVFPLFGVAGLLHLVAALARRIERASP